MFRLSNIRISTKLAVMSGAAALMAAAMLSVQLFGNVNIKTGSVSSARQFILVNTAEEAKAATRGVQLAVRDLRLSRTAEEIVKATENIGRLQLVAMGLIEKALQTTKTQENLERLTKAKALEEKYVAEAKGLEALQVQIAGLAAKRGSAGAGDVDKQIADLTDQSFKFAREHTLPIAAELDDVLTKLVEFSSGRFLATAAATKSDLESAELLSIGAGTAVILLLIGSAVFGAVSIAKPLRALTKPLGELAKGNFTITIPGLGRKDEVGQIANAVATMAEQVRTTIGEIKTSTREVTNASAEIATSSTDLSQRTEEQAASLEQTSAAMEEISSTVKKNADNAQQANVSAATTRKVADRGGSVVAEAVAAMAKIEESSRKISDIIGVIDEIARQTNLLALNAAVEAARAGDAGRGFAVVASEVRSLAGRSSQAAKDIKNLITNSNSEVSHGVELVNQAGTALTEIVESIKTVATIIADIASASAEQAVGLDEINKALNQMDDVTQQNSALVEENAATAKTLEHQAQAMNEQVAYFHIEEVAADTEVPATPEMKSDASSPKIADSRFAA